MNKNPEIIKLIYQALQKEPKPKIRRPFKIAIAGATGIVGKELISILQERKFPVAKLILLASGNSAGKKLEFGDEEIVVQVLNEKRFDNIDIAFFALDNVLARKYCAIAAKKGVICIDKSSAHRNMAEIPLIVPEVNKHDLKHFSKTNIIASPNCTTSPLVQVLKPLHDIAPIKRVVVSSYQAVSGAGKAGIEELSKQVRDLLNFRDVSSNIFQGKIAFNVLPAIPTKNGVDKNGSSEEEQKVIEETKKILNLPNLGVAATCVRVPVFNGHSEAVHIEFERDISLVQTRQALARAPGLVVINDIANGIFPTPSDASGEDFTLVGRIRKDLSVKHGIALWLSSDNLRTGAALNAVKIAESLCEEYLS